MQIFKIILFALFLILSTTFCSQSQSKVLTGLDNINDYQHLFKNKRIGIITNHTAYNSQGKHITDVFLAMPNVQVTALFGPEHGIKGSSADGEEIDNTVDPIKDIPVFSLYGQTRKATPEMLKNVDVLVFDIQDIGSRYYTYIYTMAFAMEAAAEQNIPFVILDRPNPINGVQVEGNILDLKYRTFVGMYPIAVRHGMTVGELARMFNGEGWLENDAKAELTVIPLKYWQRQQWYDQTGLKFIKPSPNMPNLETATVYPGLCLLEGSNLSEGRGTNKPFMQIGAPWVNGKELANGLNHLKLAGVNFEAVTFTPKEIPGTAVNPKHENKLCEGVQVQVINRTALNAFSMGVQVMNTLFLLYPDSMQWRVRHFDRLSGTDRIRKTIIAHDNIGALFEQYLVEAQNFNSLRKKYLIY